ncbi:hypothetical protein [Methylobacterium nodulans]|uniref:Uncharacterized protein n=1 Tax=Methylobacterium nodulans (strain LMG 21967 / CNCM I-2342 / ORS 2060) TaxID=460265 RepID=B8IRP4_METNO|nr:hypothetical protein [Methylobacterium nodulans]ACL60594.1 hypothetical protein Mnod_5765 [Methylobacterium nodulans ORS 2060]
MNGTANSRTLVQVWSFGLLNKGPGSLEGGDLSCPGAQMAEIAAQLGIDIGSVHRMLKAA